MASQTASQVMKLCFVTVGATASFDLLLLSVLDEVFLKSLQQFGYTHLLVQYGKDGQTIFENFLGSHPAGDPSLHGIEIEGFDFNQAGLGREMRLAQANPSEGRSGGVIISHAGSGSILEAMRLGIPLVVVPNASLKDNHQEELARELQKQGYVVASNSKDVANAVGKAEALRSRMLTWPPVRGASQKHQRTLDQVLSDEMGFLD
ncbi:hypothetical protein ASPWEDRAFT_22579 [Aspergillus wentii DTO 134E9]|uniref:UDP-N-acetylglucosamine transferase subunit ALG13 n=1 Tax=Aspergillus wentii DTO 134E9 TaxID=1073089 RepID=A0A1L9RZS4_ASPWE|nr:uncharacterized protein ASPWEDRAFT_22579 [Aspergillus wentii DTO 134E9]KAI9932814.1 N-acetylglucosaminyldiphosphodolichol N-acetylglucosaminyltransferase catalytic subunit alg13 [Aspergillus wentii]OJJ40394.1 hypothetical protein ASPWEDRAFT_22579 [Aspergillus wentii DTO 134E9]